MRRSLLAITLAAAALSANEADCLVEIPCQPIEPVYLSLWHREGKGVGFDKGYSSIELFLPQYKKSGDMIPYLDLRGHIFNDGKFAGNIGIGLRNRLCMYDSYLGPNLYFDIRRRGHKTFYQLGAGIELIGACWNISGNGYIPLGNRGDLRSVKFKQFDGNNAKVEERSFQSMFGADVRIRRTVWDCDWVYVNVTAAPYYYWADFGKSAGGGFLRARVRFLDTITVGAKVSYDSLFRWRGLGEIGATFAFGGKKCTMKRSRAEANGCCCVDPLMRNVAYEPDRQEIIVVSEQKKTETLKNPQGDPYFFIHVDNEVDPFGASGNGTAELPYSTLMQAQSNSTNGDIIYVHRGNGSPQGMSDGFIFQDAQSLLGSGVSHTLDSVYSQPVEIPALTPGQNPQITNPAALGVGVTLANGNILSGVDISGLLGPGVLSVAPTYGSTIDRCQIIDATTSGIELQLAEGIDIGGTFKISNNLITTTNGGTDGIEISTDGGGTGDMSVDVAIVSNQIVGNVGFGIQVLRNVETGDFALSGKIDGNEISGNAIDGINTTYTGVTTPIILDLVISDNEISANGSEGIFIDRANGNLDLIGNTISRCTTAEGAQIELEVGCILASKCIGNSFFDNIGAGLHYDNNSATNILTLDFIDNFVGGDVATNDHFLFTPITGSTMFIRMKDNQGRFESAGTGIILIK